MVATASRPPATDERLLLERTHAGDHAAFNILFERHKAKIYRFCLLMLGDEAATDDIYQDVFLNFYHACRQGEIIRNVRNYLVTSARNRCLNFLRISQRHVALDDSPVPVYELDTISPDLGMHLRTALMQIHPQYREAFLLFEIEGYSYEEIGTQLEISHDVVRNRIYRAKLALQKILRPLLREEGNERGGMNQKG